MTDAPKPAFTVSTRRVDTHGSVAQSKDAIITLDTGLTDVLRLPGTSGSRARGSFVFGGWMAGRASARRRLEAAALGRHERREGQCAA